VDGVYLGLSRWNQEGIDLEDRWCEWEKPETQAMKQQIDAFMAGDNPIKVSLNLHTTLTRRKKDSFFFKHIQPSVTKAFEDIQQRYIDAFANATPLFGNLSPSFSQLHECRFVESYYWNNWGESVMAMTYETHYYHRVGDREFITDEDLSEIGAAMAYAMIEYFGLKM
jgi:hypothetical protein